jgi:hypothetical protein
LNMYSPKPKVSLTSVIINILSIVNETPLCRFRINWVVSCLEQRIAIQVIKFLRTEFRRVHKHELVLEHLRITLFEFLKEVEAIHLEDRSSKIGPHVFQSWVQYQGIEVTVCSWFVVCKVVLSESNVYYSSDIVWSQIKSLLVRYDGFFGLESIWKGSSIFVP